MIARWWGGGRLAAVNRALGILGRELTEVDVEGSRGLVLTKDVPELLAARPATGVRVLPGFDPFTNELPRRVDSVLSEARHALVHRTAGWVTPLVLVDGRIAGTWELRSNAGRATIEVTPWGRWRGRARKELGAEVDRIGVFLDRPVKLLIGSAVG
jgi:hypothetical protein